MITLSACLCRTRRRPMDVLQRLRSQERGFTLVEATVAGLIAMIMVIILSVVLSSALRSLQNNRLHTAATSMATEIIEVVRDLPYEEIAHHPSDISVSDPYVITGLKLSYPGLPEELVATDPAGGVDPHVTMEVVSDVTFTKRAYVTYVEANLKRVVSVVSWTLRGDDKVVMTETLITEPSEGLGP